jgi:magnesium-transporting ATPase (P-type)
MPPALDNPGEVEIMDDSLRAAQQGNFKVTKQQLIDIIECYRNRKFVEELTILNDVHHGESGIMQALDVANHQAGISTNSLKSREAAFGSNHKDLPTRSGFCSMVLAALDDIMLKVLIVCAVFSIIVDMSFAAGDPEKLKTAWIEGFAILFAVAVVSLVSAWSDYKKEG